VARFLVGRPHRNVLRAGETVPFSRITRAVDVAVGNLNGDRAVDVAVIGDSSVGGVRTGVETLSAVPSGSLLPQLTAVPLVMDQAVPGLEGCEVTPAQRVAIAEYDQCSGPGCSEDVWFVGRPDGGEELLVCVLRSSPTSGSRHILTAADGRDVLGKSGTSAAGPVLSFFVDHLDSDGLLDVGIAFPDAAGVTQFVAVRRRPRPGATFITLLVHGQVGTLYSQALARGPFPQVPLDPDIQVNMDFTLGALLTRTSEADAARRPANDTQSGEAGHEDLPPVDHVALSGHWEQDTVDGARQTAFGRVSAGVSMALSLPNPLCGPNPVALVAPFPVQFRTTGLPVPSPMVGVALEPHQWWAQMAFYALFPVICPVPPPSGPPHYLLDVPGLAARAGAAGLAYALWQSAAPQSSAASRRVAREFAAAVSDQATKARQRMGGPCAGQVFVDMIGASRGTSVISQTLDELRREQPGSAMRLDAPLLSNAAVRMVLADAIDPRPRNPWFPWIHSGHAVRDARIEAARDESWVSLTAGRSIDLTGSGVRQGIDLALTVIPGWYGNGDNRCDDDGYSCLFPNPVGYLRTDFGADTDFLVRNEMAATFTHVSIFSRTFMHDDADVPFLPGTRAADIGYQRDTLWGEMLSQPEGMRFQIPDLTGWHGAAHQAGTLDAEDCGGPGADPIPALLPARRRAAPDGFRQRIFLQDGCFRVSRAVVRGSILVDGNPTAKAAAGDFLEDPTGYLAGIAAIARDEWPTDGPWKVLSARAPRLVGINEPGQDVQVQDATDLMRQQWELPPVGSAQATGETVTQQLSRTAVDNPDLGDAITAHLSSTLAGLQTAGEAMAVFPPGEQRSIEQELSDAAELTSTLHITADFELEDGGCLELALRGHGLSHLSTWCAAVYGPGRHRMRFQAGRDALAGPMPQAGAREYVTLRGNGVAVHCVTVSDRGPFVEPVTGAAYVLVVEDDGLDWRHAQAAAARHVFAGSPGRLADFGTQQELETVVQGLGLDVDAWVGGYGVPSEGAFRWVTGTAVDPALIGEAPPASRQDVHHLLVRGAAPHHLVASRPRISGRGFPMGYIVEFAPGTATPGGMDILVSLQAGLLVRFTEVTAGETSATSSPTPNLPLPAGTRAVGGFWEIATSAETTGPVEVCIPVPPGVDTARVQLAHQTGGAWVLLDTQVSPDGTRACAWSDGLSQFVLVVLNPLVPPMFEGVVPVVQLEQASPAGTAFSLPLPTARAQDGTLLTVYASAPAFFPPGETVVTFNALAPGPVTGTATTLVRVVDTTAPAFLVVPPDVVVEATSSAGAAVHLPAPMVLDAADPSPGVSSDAPAVFPLGVTVVTWTAADHAGNSSTVHTVVTVVDTTPPVLLHLSVTPVTLWPPNHKMETVTVTAAAADVVDAGVACFIEAIESSETAAGPGHAHDVDWMFTGPLSALLRAERLNGQTARVYTLAVACVDDAGNPAHGAVSVTVPGNQSAP